MVDTVDHLIAARRFGSIMDRNYCRLILKLHRTAIPFILANLRPICEQDWPWWMTALVLGDIIKRENWLPLSPDLNSEGNAYGILKKLFTPV